MSDHSDADDNNEETWDDWLDDDAASDGASVGFGTASAGAARCVACDRTGSPGYVLAHMASEHGLDLAMIRRHLGLDYYGCIRLVNFLRTKAAGGAEYVGKDAFAKVTGAAAQWQADDALLKPVLEDDALLTAGEFFDDDEDEDDDAGLAEGVGKLALKATTQPEAGARADGAAVAALEKELARTRKAFAEYRDMVRATFLDESRASETAPKRPAGAGDVDGYFASYSGADIHETMLKDAARTEAYRDWVYGNKAAFAGKAVLDVGCGTGILSMFAARAGAARVVAVDNSDMADIAARIVAANGLDGVITVVRGEIETVKLPVSKFDIIISEWMGYFLLYEGMFDSVIYARDEYLAEGGCLGPSSARVLVGALEHEDWVNDRLHFWGDVYGFDMSPIKEGIVSEGQVAAVDATKLISAPAVVA
ncbi:hypothetical protein HK405_012655, partial [Cladochytrium tenue]